MKFEVYADTGGHYRWRLLSGSNKVAASGESFASKSNAERAATGFKSGGLDRQLSFVSKDNAERSAYNVRDHAGSATGP